MKITAIYGSPKKKGFTSRLTDIIINEAEKNNNKCSKIYLNDLKLKDCAGCMKCQKDEKCVIRDDIEIIENAFKESDLIIYSSPVRWGNVSGLMLKAFERLFGFLVEERIGFTPVPKNAIGKKAVIVTSCSTKNPFDKLFNQSTGCIKMIKEVLTYSKQKLVKKLILPGTLGMKEIPSKIFKKAEIIGRSL